MTPRLAVAVNFAQLVALASHSKFSLQGQTNTLRNILQVTFRHPFLFWQAQLPEELITCGSCMHERVGYYCGCVAHRISDCILE